MTADDRICTAMFACQKAMRPLALPHRKAVLHALTNDSELCVVTKGGRLKRGQRKPLYRGRKGLDASNRMSATILVSCRGFIVELTKKERSRVFRGLMSWLLEDVSPTIDFEMEEAY